jgi:hypothetical protein
MATSVPLTIETNRMGPIDQNPEIVIGSSSYTVDSALQNIYRALVVDRTNLNVVQNFHFTDNHTIPAQLLPYNNNPQYLLILNTQNLYSPSLPTGQFYAFLQELGSGAALQSIEQIFQTLNCGGKVNFCYTMIAVFDGSVCFDYSYAYDTYRVYTLLLEPVEPPTGGVLYTPVQLE